jgi:hypothetical protein
MASLHDCDRRGRPPPPRNSDPPPPAERSRRRDYPVLAVRPRPPCRRLDHRHQYRLSGSRASGRCLARQPGLRDLLIAPQRPRPTGAAADFSGRQFVGITECPCRILPFVRALKMGNNSFRGSARTSILGSKELSNLSYDVSRSRRSSQFVLVMVLTSARAETRCDGVRHREMQLLGPAVRSRVARASRSLCAAPGPPGRYSLPTCTATAPGGTASSPRQTTRKPLPPQDAGQHGPRSRSAPRRAGSS